MTVSFTHFEVYFVEFYLAKLGHVLPSAPKADNLLAQPSRVVTITLPYLPIDENYSQNTRIFWSKFEKFTNMKYINFTKKRYLFYAKYTDKIM